MAIVIPDFLCIAIAFFIFCEFFLQLKRIVCCEEVEKARQDRHLWENGVDLPALLLLSNKQLKAKSKKYCGSGDNPNTI